MGYAVGGWRSASLEVGGIRQRSEVGSQRSENRRQKTEDRRQEADGSRGWRHKTEVGSQRSEDKELLGTRN